MEKTITTEWEGGELFGVEIDIEIELVCDFEPPVAPVPCSNPDDPAFSDPGDCGMIDLQAILITTPKGKRVNILPILPQAVVAKLEIKADEYLLEEADYE